MDPGRIALPSPLAKGSILLHEIRARVHDGHRKTKKALLQEPLLLASGDP